MTLPLEQELHDALHHDLWLVQQAMDAGLEGDPTDYIPPAHHYLWLLHDALGQLVLAREAAKAELPKDLVWKLGIEAKKHADSVETMAQHTPEVRRYWLVETLTHIVTRGIAILEEEGRPVKPVVIPKLAKVRRQY